MSYEYKDEIIMNLKDYNAGRKVTGGTHAFESKLEELDHVYAQAAKADDYEVNLNEVKRQLKIKIRHARRDGDYSEAYAFSEALDMIENLI